MAINSPYVPGDPYSYDLKWIVRQLKRLKNIKDPEPEVITDLIDTDSSTVNIPSSQIHAIRIGKVIYFSFDYFHLSTDHYYVKFNEKYTGSSAELFPLYSQTTPYDPLDVICGHFRVTDGEMDLTDAGARPYQCMICGSFVIGG